MHLIKLMYNKKLLKNLFTPKKTFLLWYLKFTLFRDPQHLTLLMYSWLYKAQIKTHKRIFFTCIAVFKILFKYLYTERKLKGFFIFFKGKLAKKGSVRKEKLFFKTGRVASGTKSLRGNITLYQIPTLTGTIGAAAGLFF